MIATRLAITIAASVIVGTLAVLAIDYVSTQTGIVPPKAQTIFLLAYAIPALVAWRLVARQQLKQDKDQPRE